jgi:cytochrome c oxidase subunit 2
MTAPKGVLLAVAASRMAGKVDLLFLYLVIVAGFFSALIFLLIFVFAIRYRRRSPSQRARATKATVALEVLWFGVPLSLSLVMFFWGAKLYLEGATSPPGAMEVDVVAKQWMWKIQHRSGSREINRLHVPLGRPVRLRLISEDVIHSFFVPAFRVKRDVLPGRYSYLNFTPTRLGTYHLFCAQYCGTNHSQMIGEVEVIEPARFQEWLAGGSESLSPKEAGAQLFQKLGCVECHGHTATQRGPDLAGLVGRTVHLRDGRTIVADAGYVRRSILDPTADVVEGYDPIMPTFKGQVNEEDVLHLLAYIEGLTEGAPK